MKIQTYEDAGVELVRSTKEPGKLVQAAMKLTMSKQYQEQKEISVGSLDFLIDAGHTSILEHVGMTFVLEGVSRSFLAQITRHRMSSFTSASQHYADYRDMPMVIDESLIDNGVIESTLTVAIESYVTAVDYMNVKPEEARQILPNAAAVNIVWTVNARSLLNFFRQRLCHRNVSEMQIIAGKILNEVYTYWPEYDQACGPACHMDGKCDQGKMSCGIAWRRLEEK